MKWLIAPTCSTISIHKRAVTPHTYKSWIISCNLNTSSHVKKMTF